LYRPSRYNFRFPASGGLLLYNANTGAVVSLAGRDGARLAKLLMRPSRTLQPSSLSASMRRTLVGGGFLVSPRADELAEIRERFARARVQTPMVLTITTTMDCNLGCYYCYEERDDSRLEAADLPALLAYIRRRLEASGKARLHIDWYGGEPLLNAEFIEAASPAIQQLCRTHGVQYAASVISNGTAWPDDVGNFVARHAIRQVQVSFDGLKRNHDKRRRYLAPAARAEGASSFDKAIALVDKLLDHARVDVRFNIDRNNKHDLVPFYELARDRGWFARIHPAVIQPARVAVYSESSKFLRRSELSVSEFDELRGLLRERFGSIAPIEESEVPDKFPYPKTGVCAALARDSTVIGADGTLYRCGLQAGEKSRGVGTLQTGSLKGIPIRTQGDVQRHQHEWWQGYDPTHLPKCSRCSFLPICWGGCPKKHLEGDAHAIAEQSEYWRRNLPRLVAAGVGMTVEPDHAVSEAEQFR
jgi:uncharacterized protein